MLGPSFDSISLSRLEFERPSVQLPVLYMVTSDVDVIPEEAVGWSSGEFDAEEDAEDGASWESEEDAEEGATWDTRVGMDDKEPDNVPMDFDSNSGLLQADTSWRTLHSFCA